MPDSYPRLDRIRSLMDKHYGRITPEIMMDILADHDKFPYSICKHIDETKPLPLQSVTLASYIMIPQEQVMLIAKGNPCQNEYLEYRL